MALSYVRKAFAGRLTFVTEAEEGFPLRVLLRVFFPVLFLVVIMPQNISQLAINVNDMSIFVNKITDTGSVVVS
jgi:hypothetical protein